MRLVLASIALAATSLSTIAVPAFAQTASSTVTPGMQVVDTSGGAVGTVIAVEGDNLTVKTDRHQTIIVRDSVTPHQGKLLFGMTRAELNAAVDRDIAAANAALVPGAIVRGAGGVKVGTLERIDAEFATIKLDSGNRVRIPRSGISGTAQGETVIGLTADQLEAQASAATGEPAGQGTSN
jgi:preprotein translocase subunit YajC